MEDMPLNLLLLSLTFLVFILSCAIVGFCAYRLGLTGRISRMMEDADEARKAKTEEKKNPEPTSIPGYEYNPFFNANESRYVPHQSYMEDDLDGEEPEDPRFISDEELNEQEFADDPVIPGPKRHKVVMTGGGQYGGGIAD